MDVFIVSEHLQLGYGEVLGVFKLQKAALNLVRKRIKQGLFEYKETIYPNGDKEWKSPSETMIFRLKKWAVNC